MDKTSGKRADRVLKKEGDERRARVLIALRAAFPNTIPIFAGSLEFVIGNMLVGAFDPLQAFAISLMINARHIFYGLSDRKSVV